ncbi:hypothetical protein LJC27_07930 [Christensenellaceae bacterium OttesenSCG-928-M15]|nr:hypothetical protein [Christensenellaceae bacterium OttesenSCG-928-M15]
MKIIDFVQEYSDCMNETDYFNILYALADDYGAALRKKGITNKSGVTDRVLLSSFLMQDITKLENGRYAFARKAK